MSEQTKDDHQPDQGTGTDQDRQHAANRPETGWLDLFGELSPEDVKRDLDHARMWERRSKENADAARELQTIKDAQKSEAERMTDKINTLTRERDELAAQLMRRKIADDEKLPTGAADLLTGSTEDEIRASAKRLNDLLSSKRGPQPDPSQGRDRGNSATGDWLRDQIAARSR